MKKIVLTLFIFALSSLSAVNAQINAKLMKHTAISDTQIAFVYGGDIWIANKTGGMAVQLTQSQGQESYPAFSPDGKEIAFTASYNGNSDVFVMPVTGGVPTRVTYASYYDRMVDWHPDGERLLVASRRETGVPSVNQFFLVNKKGGLAEKLAIPYGELASYHADASKLVYITKITENYPFKRYRGGLTSDLIMYDFDRAQTQRITTDMANDGQPQFVGDDIYFLSDRGKQLRLNIWKYDTRRKSFKQVTEFEQFDIGYLASSDQDLVFENGGSLYTFDTKRDALKQVAIDVVSDLSLEMPQLKSVEKSIANVSVAPGNKRLVFEARGELFDVPVKDGFTVNITQSSGAFDQSPAWSPDGKQIAFWSDDSGEYNIHIRDTQTLQTKKLTDFNSGFGYSLHWSPNNKKLAYIDEKNDINIVDADTGRVIKADNYRWNLGHGSRYDYAISWSPDSHWISYTVGLDNAHQAVYLYNLEQAKAFQVTSGFYNDAQPTFSLDGQYLYFLTDRSFQPAYSGLDDATWIYPNNTHLVALSLTQDAPNLVAPKSDELELAQAEEDDGEQKDEDSDEDASNETDAPEPLSIDWDNIESRIMVLNVKPGNLGNIIAFEDKVVYTRFANTGAANKQSKLMFYDVKERKEDTILDDVSEAVLSADGQMILVSSKKKYGLVKPEKSQKITDPIPTNSLVMHLVPKQEWRQIFNDTWRRHRDFFYDDAMQQVDWDALRLRYGALIDDARTRWDVGNIQSNLNAELSAGHTYTWGGDAQDIKRVVTGYLGIDWAQDEKGYKVKRIVRPAQWDTEVRSPFDLPGSSIKVGDYIHAVNGITLDTNKDPYAMFDGLSGKTLTLSISETGEADAAKPHTVKALTQNEEQQLRYLEWIETNRQKVDALSDGNLGYVYMSNTATRGQLELVKMYYGQLHKKGFIIDERFNGGGQLADRFLELLKRPVVYNLYWRHGKSHTWPVKANTGPMGMLINGWAGSGGDGLPWAFRELNAGPIIGERTLGILVGPATGHRLIDGGGITVPGARLYGNDGEWFKEGEGVYPDIEVWDDPNMLMAGKDPQLQRVVAEVMKNVDASSNATTPPPKKQDRTARGLR